jgi:photosystem II stability/assembly factor-like uncharacterized protein
MKNKKIIALIICTLCFSSCLINYGNQDKTDIQSKQTEFKVDLDNITKISRTQEDFDLWYSVALKKNGEIWATGGWNTRGDSIYKWSKDEGKWSSVKLPVGGGMGVDAKVFFITDLNGYIIGLNKILRSEDGGNSWEESPLPNSSEITKLQGVSFQDFNVGFIGGTTSYLDQTTFEPVPGIEILCTTDGGKVFQVCYKNKEYNSVLDIINLKQSVVIALIDGSKMLVSHNFGKSWIENSLPINTDIIAVDDKDRIWIVEKNGKFLFSDDLGNSWGVAEINNSAFNQNVWNSIAFSKNGIGIAVGNEGVIAISEGNHNWTKYKFNQIKEDLYSVQISDSHILIQGKENLYSLEIQD